LQPHEKLHRSHKTLTIQEYRANANKMKVRFCDKHEDQPYNVGCKDCLSLCCVKCLSGLKNCTSTGEWIIIIYTSTGDWLIIINAATLVMGQQLCASTGDWLATIYLH